MTDLFFFEHGADPREPDDVRIEDLSADPYRDGQRLRVKILLTPFREKPNLKLAVLDEQDVEVSSVDILETMSPVMEMTVHLRGSPAGAYRLRADLYYRDQPPQDKRTINFVVDALDS